MTRAKIHFQMGEVVLHSKNNNIRTLGKSYVFKLESSDQIKTHFKEIVTLNNHREKHEFTEGPFWKRHLE